MARKNLVRSSSLPYHVTARANNREAFHLELHKVWDILCDRCFEAIYGHGAEMHAFVLMPNHFHMLVTTPKSELGNVMRDFMRSATRSINLFGERSGRVFGGPYYGSLVDSPYYFANAFKYVYRNPVRAGLAVLAEDYPFSTLHGLAGRGLLPFPLNYPFGRAGFIGVPDDPFGLLDWVNRPSSREEELMVRKALRKTRFCLEKSGWRRTIELLVDQRENWQAAQYDAPGIKKKEWMTGPY